MTLCHIVTCHLEGFSCFSAPNLFCLPLPPGPLSIAIPGEIRGYWEAKSRYGNPAVSWASLIQPSIDMCYEGINVSRNLAFALRDKRDLVMADQGLR